MYICTIYVYIYIYIGIYIYISVVIYHWQHGPLTIIETQIY